MLEMPVLTTARLAIRPFELADLDSAYRLFDLALADAPTGSEKMPSRQARLEWLQWSVLNTRQLAGLNQPPYGDRAIVLRSTGRLVGSCGLVACLAPFEQLPNFDYYDPARRPGRSSPELGLFYAVLPDQQRRGYASEAAGALLDYAFGSLHVKQVVATTDYANLASQAVMRKLGLSLARNPLPDPPWLQVVGVIQAAPS
jgi:[ribosomal protein S5]-alanine N-acetyltransferase